MTGDSYARDVSKRIRDMAMLLDYDVILPGRTRAPWLAYTHGAYAQERGGTATGRIFQALTQDADKFQEVLQVTPETLRNAGFQANSFAELVNTDLVGALQFAATRVTEP